MKKMIPVVVVGLLVLCGLEAVAAPFHQEHSNITSWKVLPQGPQSYADELDQAQELYNWFGPIGPGPLWGFKNYIIAQSFIPTKNLLTKIDLMLGKNTTTTHDISIAIRDDLNGSNLVSATLPASDIITGNFSWEEIDITDLFVTPGDTYYIVSWTTNVTDNWYVWGLYMNGTIYSNGTIYYTINDGGTWTEEPGGDLTFRTYGTDTTTLDLTITGGFGITIKTKNTGAINATNVITHVEIKGGIFGLINHTEELTLPSLASNDSSPFTYRPLGLGPITVNVTASADNAVPVTKSATGFILLFFVIIK